MADTESPARTGAASLVGRWDSGQREWPVRVRGSRAARMGRTPDASDARNRRFTRWISAVLIVGGVAFDVITPRDYTAAPFLSAAPLIAAPFNTLRTTVATAVASSGAALVLAVVHGMRGQTGAMVEFTTVLTVALLALVTNRVVRRGTQQLESARGIAEAVQRAVLPAPPAALGGLRIAARYEAAQADARIGGDLYAVQDSPYGVRLIVGDVRGKGLGAVEAVAVVVGAFREAAEQEPALEGLAARLERALDREGATRAGIDRFEGFTTAVLGEIPPAEGTVRLISRGHPAPLLLHADGTVYEAEPATPALPLGMGELGVWPDRVEAVDFPEGATLLLFTDGVTEARDRRGRFYDPVGWLSGRAHRGPDVLLDALVADVARHTGGAGVDDMALLAIQRTSAARWRPGHSPRRRPRA
ncbi:PP2C family protein-serine/threonine phosphatase [Streptomyces sp. P1-3]|uniref:PP2C family protein-serine/threonine phosphatase n=1 Tax=Streptomyces sp. P1-3 TaxID=3421658 RepID=UPI003D36CF8D